MTVTAPRPPEVQPPTPRLTPVTQRRTGAPEGVWTTGAVLSTTALMVALVCIWVVGQMLWFGGVSEHRDQQLLYAQFRTELASATAPVGPVTPPGDPVALLTIPHLGVEQVVVEGTASGDMLAGPGHLRDTVLPGQAGTSVVFGRAATYGAPFQRLPDLHRGDQISVVMAQGQRMFHVTGIRRAGDPLPRPPAAGVARLTLVTAEGSGRFGDIAPGQVIYVDAEAKKGFAAPGGLPTAVPTSETVMANEPGALPLLVVCLALLLGLTLGVLAARQRWSAIRVWVVASAPVIALAWFTTDVVMRLLPNLM